jgi:2-oxoisovalerate dehydrogenase E1 component
MGFQIELDALSSISHVQEPDLLSSTSPLPAELKRKLLLTILESRHGDMREESLNRQGKGHFHISAQGHEAMATFGMLMQPDDYACPYYRDRAFVLGRGVTTRQLALDYMAKRESSSRGRQMPSHYSYPKFHIWSVPTPTASQLLPACGMAWGMQLDGIPSLTLATVGEAATRQGDFYETVAFAKERQLPLLLVVEDNGYGISSPTRATNPLALGVLAADDWLLVDGWEVERVYHAAAQMMDRIRAGSGPGFIWIRMERLSSHTSSDDQSIYRSPEELSTLAERDPLNHLREQVIAEGALTAEEFDELNREVKERVRADYLAAETAENPLARDLETNVVTPPPQLDETIFHPGKYRMGDTVNLTLRAGLAADPRRVIFGEDVEDPKGGVFTLTKGLSTDFPKQVFNSPLAESTILGVACGLASYGRRPIFELQFIDFIYPGWNQLVTNLATLRWRTFGRWTCPAVIYAPYGAYLPGGALWHSQANEAAIAHYPGLNVVIPSTPDDAAGLLWSAMHGEDPTIVLIPKHMLWAEQEVKASISAVPIGRGRYVTRGKDVTLVAWGNTVEKVLEAIAQLGARASIELIDLRSISPWDRDMVEESVRKTGRLVVVQEDTENCSVGQMIISHLAGRPAVWTRVVSPPELVSKGNVMIGYNPIYEYAALPDVPRIVEAVERVIQGTVPRSAAHAAAAPTAQPTAPAAVAPRSPSPVPASVAEVVVKVPIMGEGIRTVRIVSLLKKPGDRIALDDALCEVETDKAVYPIEASCAGTLKEWRCQIDDEFDIGTEIAVISVDVAAAAAPPVVAREEDIAPAASVSGTPVTAAMSPAITRRLASVVPASMQLDVLWDAVTAARARAKKEHRASTPSLIVAWCLTRAIERHDAFRRLISPDGQVVQQDAFDLGVAVALEGDRLATAVIHDARRWDWPGFCAAYDQAIESVRAGRIEEVRASVNLTSLGGFGIETAIPIVVPPSMATLFAGKTHERVARSSESTQTVEVATMSLTFDHRVVNGAGAAAFLHELKAELERFRLPD